MDIKAYLDRIQVSAEPELSLSYLSLLQRAHLYNIPLQDLFDLLSQELDSIKKEVYQHPKIIEAKKAMAAVAN